MIKVLRRRKKWNQRRLNGVGSAPVAAKEPEEQKTPAELYQEKFGRKPHGRMKEATILERLKDGNP